MTVAVIILGHVLSRDGTLDQIGKERTNLGKRHANKLARQGHRVYLILSGGNPKENSSGILISEARAMDEHDEVPLDPSIIVILEEDSTHTVGNAYHSVEKCQVNNLTPEGLNEAHVITSNSLHCWRGWIYFKRRFKVNDYKRTRVRRIHARYRLNRTLVMQEVRKIQVAILWPDGHPQPYEPQARPASTLENATHP